MTYITVAFLAIFALMCFWASIADAYDAERFQRDPDYCRYGASPRVVMAWWWNKRRIR